MATGDAHPRWVRVLLVALSTLVVIAAAWWWLGAPASTTAVGGTAYAGPPDAPAVTQLDVSPTAARPRERVAVSFRSRRATGVFGAQRRSYMVRAGSSVARSACVTNRDRVLDARPAGYRLRAVLDPARGDGGPLGWCPGAYRGTVTYVVDRGCPAATGCRRAHVVARFRFTVSE